MNAQSAEEWRQSAMPWLSRWTQSILFVNQPIEGQYFSCSGDDEKRMIREFTWSLLQTLVFGLAHRVAHGETGGTYIDGFYAKYGRLPTERDRVIITAFQRDPLNTPHKTIEPTGVVLFSHRWIVQSIHLLE